MNYWTPGNHKVHRKGKICEEKVRNQTNWGTFVKILCERPLETLGSLGTSPSVLFLGPRGPLVEPSISPVPSRPVRANFSSVHR